MVQRARRAWCGPVAREETVCVVRWELGGEIDYLRKRKHEAGFAGSRAGVEEAGGVQQGHRDGAPRTIAAKVLLKGFKESNFQN